MPHRAFVTVSYEGDGSDQPDAKAAAKSVELLRKFNAAGQPFLLATGFVRPHYPMVAPRPFFERYPHTEIELPPVPANDLDDIPPPGIPGSNSRKNGLAKYPGNQQRMWSGYYATVTFMDEQVGRLLDELDRLGLTDSTVVVFTSDHGYHLGDHTFWQKSNLHEQVTRVPLIIGLQWTRQDGSPEHLDRGEQRGVRPGYDIDYTRPFTGGPLALGFDRFFGISASLTCRPSAIWKATGSCTCPR